MAYISKEFNFYKAKKKYLSNRVLGSNIPTQYIRLF